MSRIPRRSVLLFLGVCCAVWAATAEPETQTMDYRCAKSAGARIELRVPDGAAAGTSLGTKCGPRPGTWDAGACDGAENEAC